RRVSSGTPTASGSSFSFSAVSWSPSCSSGPNTASPSEAGTPRLRLFQRGATMDIAITGATGFLGRYLVRQLATAGHRLRCWYRPASDRGGFEASSGSIDWVAGSLGDATASA